MNNKNKQLTDEERMLLGQFKGRHSLRTIARFMGRHVSTLSRELSRNKTETIDYSPLKAHRMAKERFQKSHQRPRLKNEGLRGRVESLLKLKWSPEIIAGRLAKEANKKIISPEAIYQWIYADARYLISELPCQRRHRRHRAKNPWPPREMIPQRVSIKERPSMINTREQEGHWEADLVVGPGRPAIQVAVERKTRFSRLLKISDHTAASAYRALYEIFSSYPKILRNSVTYDNGFENALHAKLNQVLDMRSYFCDPYSSWQKGTIENTNGLIRRLLPKRTDFAKITEAEIERVESWLNDRPRKCLDFQTPAEAFRRSVAIAP
jgi:IS30 family transposase